MTIIDESSFTVSFYRLIRLMNVVRIITCETTQDTAPERYAASDLKVSDINSNLTLYHQLFSVPARLL